MLKCVRCYHPDGSTEDFLNGLPFDDIRKRLNGYVEVHNMGPDVLCDEEGKLKGLQPTARWKGQTFVGDLFVGHLTDKGLLPVSEEVLLEFERRVIIARSS